LQAAENTSVSIVKVDPFPILENFSYSPSPNGPVYLELRKEFKNSNHLLGKRKRTSS